MAVRSVFLIPLLLVACSDYQIHDQNDAAGKYNPPDLGAEVKTDRIVQVTIPSVDVLWVIDNSCSMDDNQTALTSNFSKFMDYFTDSGLDYHVGVVSTDMYNPQESGRLTRDSGTTYIDNSFSAAEANQSFARRAALGTYGSGYEKGLDAAWSAVSMHGNTFNQGFYRDDSAFAMIVISDEEDQSDNVSVPEFISWASSLKPSTEMVSFSSIVWQSQCGSGPTGNETDGKRYMQVTDAIGGIKWPICNSAWDTVLAELGMQAAGLRREFFLSSVPVVDSIEVEVLGVSGSQVFNVDSDFSYDRARNSVRFSSFVPEPLDEVLITYAVLASASLESEVIEDTGE